VFGPVLMDFSPDMSSLVVYVDGGVMWNYPIGVFDELLGVVNDETLGFHVESSALPHTNHTITPHDYFAGLFGRLVRQQEAD